MAKTKKNKSQIKSESNAEYCASALKAISDSARLRIIELLMEKSQHVSELNETLEMEQSLLSHHLKILRTSGLVTSVRDGKSVLYSLAPSVEPQMSKKAVNLGCCLLSFN